MQVKKFLAFVSLSPADKGDGMVVSRCDVHLHMDNMAEHDQPLWSGGVLRLFRRGHPPYAGADLLEECSAARLKSCAAGGIIYGKIKQKGDSAQI